MAAAKKKTAPAKKKTASAKATKSASGASKTRADFGSPIDGYIEKQAPEARAVATALRAMIEKAMPEAASSIKWGMPVFEVDGQMAAALRVTKAGVALIMSGDPASFKDPKGLLEQGSAKNMRQLKVAALADLPKKEVEAWLKVAAKK